MLTPPVAKNSSVCFEENGILRGFEHQVFRKDGSKIWISVNARAVRDEGGAIRYYEGTAQDINGRKRAEARSAAFATLARKLSGARTQLDAGRIITQTADDLFGWDSCDLNLYDADRDLIHHILSVDTIDGGKLTSQLPFQIESQPPGAAWLSLTAPSCCSAKSRFSSIKMQFLSVTRQGPPRRS